jgi:hypothetical protein
VGWDTQYEGKTFGVYPPGMSKEEFMHLLLDIPWAQRHCYELLVENVPCKAYADVEWVGPPEEDHDTLTLIIAAISAKVREAYSRDPMIYVCCGLRPVANSSDQEPLVKHSYHVMCDNINVKQLSSIKLELSRLGSVSDGADWKHSEFRHLPYCINISGRNFA